MEKLTSFVRKISVYLQEKERKSMSPRALLIDGFDFFFYSKEETRRHIHIEKGEKNAKIWLEPNVEVAYNHGFTSKEMKYVLQIIQEYGRSFDDKWNKHFGNQTR